MSFRRTSGRPPVFIAATASMLVAGLLLLPVHPANAAPDSGAKRGDALFHERCVNCHNKQAGDTTPFGPPNLHGILRNKVITPAEAAAIIRQGKGQMPPFGAVLKANEIDDLIAYLKTQ